MLPVPESSRRGSSIPSESLCTKWASMDFLSPSKACSLGVWKCHWINSIFLSPTWIVLPFGGLTCTSSQTSSSLCPLFICLLSLGLNRGVNRQRHVKLWNSCGEMECCLLQDMLVDALLPMRQVKLQYRNLDCVAVLLCGWLACFIHDP
jgi:hypothetical protein